MLRNFSTKFIVAVLFLSCLKMTQAQNSSVETTKVNTERFPEVSFIWIDDCPVEYSKNQFALFENEQRIDTFSVENVEIVAMDSMVKSRHKSVLILWEDPGYRTKLTDFANNIIYYFFEQLKQHNGDGELYYDANDRFSLCVFNKLRKEGELLLTLSDFTEDISYIEDTLSKYDARIHGTDRSSVQKKSTDLLPAIEKGIGKLELEPEDNIKALFVITSGITNAFETNQIIKKSTLHKIPIYVIDLNSSQTNPAIVQVVENTYGGFINVAGNTDNKDIRQNTINEMLVAFDEMQMRYFGQQYLISFVSQEDRNGEASTIMLKINDISHLITYTKPSFSLVLWMQTNLVLFIILSVVIVCVLAFGVFFLVKYINKRNLNKKKQKDSKKKQEANMIAEQEMLKRQIQIAEEELSKHKSSVEKEKQDKEQNERISELADLMQKKNLFPRLVIISGTNEIYNMYDPVISIGRDEDNDIVLPYQTISRHHAKIMFTGSGFEVCDLSSTNGVLVNDSYVNSVLQLRNGDIINIGDVIIKFYV